MLENGPAYSDQSTVDSFQAQTRSQYRTSTSVGLKTIEYHIEYHTRWDWNFESHLNTGLVIESFGAI